MQEARSSTEAEKRLSAIECTLAVVRNASRCVCESCGGAITGAGFVEAEPELLMWHEECMDNQPIMDVHRTDEGNYAFSLAPQDAGEELMAVRVSDFGMIRSQAVGSATENATTETSQDQQGSASNIWRTALADALTIAERIGEQLRRASYEPSSWPYNLYPEEDRRHLLLESQEAAMELPRAIGEALRLFDGVIRMRGRRPDDAVDPDEAEAAKGPDPD